MVYRFINRSIPTSALLLFVGCSAGGGATGAATCGFVMPNPAGAGLPHAASYQDNANGSVTDRVTGLTWDRLASAATVTELQAVATCARRGLPWRLPTRIELVSLVDFTVPSPGPTINPIFRDTPATVFWTSSRAADSASSAWGVFFDIGYADVDDVSDAGNARCVSAPGGAAPCEQHHYSAAGPGEITDVATGLTWKQDPAPQAATWARAQSYCAGLSGAWRLPSMTELQTLVDVHQSGSTIDPQAFPNTDAVVFWTSSPVAGMDIYAWGVDFGSGTTTNPDVASPYAVRCVR